MGCNTESNFKLLYYHYLNSRKPFAKETIQVYENHTRLISDTGVSIKVIPQLDIEKALARK
ncbi:hypothetical protein [Nitrosopumilus sp. Nsub]|uniref:hypothetical protein n=1 Tax=Nitrosopumilus sp. Nsub TaxID=1776294 RepID=UPI00082AA349|nr:hypothetical protein [Nitrosopumilus sp. Nsub]